MESFIRTFEDLNFSDRPNVVLIPVLDRLVGLIWSETPGKGYFVDLSILRCPPCGLEQDNVNRLHNFYVTSHLTNFNCGNDGYKAEARIPYFCKCYGGHIWKSSGDFNKHFKSFHNKNYKESPAKEFRSIIRNTIFGAFKFEINTHGKSKKYPHRIKVLKFFQSSLNEKKSKKKK